MDQKELSYLKLNPMGLVPPRRQEHKLAQPGAP
jgi:hypothetical protein